MNQDLFASYLSINNRVTSPAGPAGPGVHTFLERWIEEAEAEVDMVANTAMELVSLSPNHRIWPT